MKVLTLVGTRPEIIKLSRVVNAVTNSFDHLFVHSGQNYDYELNEIFFEQLDIPKPDYFLGINSSITTSPSEFVGRAIIALDELLARTTPQAVLLLGDTNSGLATIAAKKRKIPIFHMEAGNRCFDSRVPEETNRRIIDHFSDINLVYTEHARRNLIAEGLPADRIYLTGSPMREVLDYNRPNILASTVIERLSLRPNEYIVASFHREENVDDRTRLTTLAETLGRVSSEFDLPIVISLHPRTRKRIEQFGLRLPKNILELKPLGFHDYVQLQRGSFCVLSDSGTVTEESALEGFAAVNVRDAHERPEGVDVGTVPMTGIQSERVIAGIHLSRNRRIRRELPDLPLGYEPIDVSHRVANTILSYLNYGLS